MNQSNEQVEVIYTCPNQDCEDCGVQFEDTPAEQYCSRCGTHLQNVQFVDGE